MCAAKVRFVYGALELDDDALGKSLTVQDWSVDQSLSELFTVNVVVTAKQATIRLEDVVGRPATFRIVEKGNDERIQGWTGIVSLMAVERVETTGLSYYRLALSPPAWLLTKRRNHRIFQHVDVPTIIKTILDEWGVPHKWSIDAGRYPKLETKIQYGETDYDFIRRLIEECGLAYRFELDEANGSTMSFGDALEKGNARGGNALRFVEDPGDRAPGDWVTAVTLGREVRSGAYALADYDFRRPAARVRVEAPKANGEEAKYEIYDYEPGAMLAETGKDGGTPVADKLGKARVDAEHGKQLATSLLHGERQGRELVSFSTNAVDVVPGMVLSIEHPHPRLSAGNKLLVCTTAIHGGEQDNGEMTAQAVFADSPYREEAVTPKPQVEGVQSAIVVGPKNEEIHVDEFGRIKVQFLWDRESKSDDSSSCWMRVTQGWAGRAFGMMQWPRVGQEVLVSFLAGDCDQPVVVGTVFNGANGLPHQLPQHQTRSTLRSHSTPKGTGLNEIQFDDKKDAEMIHVQAERDLQGLVKHDEFIIVDHDLERLVKQNERQWVHGVRTEVTKQNRTEVTSKDRTLIVNGTLSTLTKGDHSEQIDGSHEEYFASEHHVVVAKDSRERVDGDRSLEVKGVQNRAIDGSLSRIVRGAHHINVGENYGLDVATTVHLKSGTKVVVEAGSDVTFKTSTCYVRIDSSGVTVKGPLLLINSGGSPGTGSGASPKAPKAAKNAKVEPPRLQAYEVPERKIGEPKPQLPPVKEPAKPSAPKMGEAKVDRSLDHKAKTKSTKGDGDAHRGSKKDGGGQSDKDSKGDNDNKLAWIAVELVDEDGKPVEGERCEITLPDGKVHKAATDKEGKVTVKGLKQDGSCKVTFPRLDKDVWKKG